MKSVQNFYVDDGLIHMLNLLSKGLGKSKSSLVEDSLKLFFKTKITELEKEMNPNAKTP